MTVHFVSQLPARGELVNGLLNQHGASVDAGGAVVGTVFEAREYVHSKALYANRTDTSAILIAEEEVTAVKVFLSDIRDTEFSHKDDFRVYREQRDRFVRDVKTWIAKSKRFGDLIDCKVEKVDLAMSFGEREVMLGVTRSFRLRFWNDLKKDGLTRLSGPAVSLLIGPVLSLSGVTSALIILSSSLTVLINSIAAAIKADELQLEEVANGS